MRPAAVGPYYPNRQASLTIGASPSATPEVPSAMRTVVGTGVADVLRASARTYRDDTACQRREEVGDDDSR